jgi:hypothetical protein
LSEVDIIIIKINPKTTFAYTLIIIIILILILSLLILILILILIILTILFGYVGCDKFGSHQAGGRLPAAGRPPLILPNKAEW